MVFIKILKNTIQTRMENIDRFDDVTADMISNKKHNPRVIELFIKSRKIKMSVVFAIQSYFAVPNKVD